MHATLISGILSIIVFLVLVAIKPGKSLFD